MQNGKNTTLSKLEIIDADNLEIIREDEPRLLINFPMLRNLMSGGPWTKRIYYIPKGGFTSWQRRRVEVAGYEVETTYKNSDAWFLVNGVLLGQSCKSVAIVGGDHCLIPLLEVLKRLGIRREVWSWDFKTHNRVKDLADHYQPLDHLGIVLGRDEKGWQRRQWRRAKRFGKRPRTETLEAACA